MILDKLADLLASLLAALVGLLPQGHLGLDGVEAAWESMFALNYFLPIAEVAIIVLTVIAFAPAFIVTTLTFWVIALVRGGNAKG